MRDTSRMYPRVSEGFRPFLFGQPRLQLSSIGGREVLGEFIKGPANSIHVNERGR
jgi:hypothetical protein